jgi:hypothetical protein
MLRPYLIGSAYQAIDEAFVKKKKKKKSRADVG